MNKLFKRTAAMFAAVMAIAFGGWAGDIDARLGTSISASAADEVVVSGGIDESITADVTDSSVKLNWQKQNAYSHYAIYLKDADGELTLQKFSTVESVQIDDLEADREYTFMIEGQSDALSEIIGEMTVRTSKKLLTSAPAVAIENMTVMGLKTSEAADEVSFSFVKQDGIDYHNVYQKLADGSFKFLTYTSGDLVTVRDLEPQKQYTFAIRGETNKHYTPMTYVTVKTLEDLESVEHRTVQNLKASEVKEDSVTLSWELQDRVDNHIVYLTQADGSYKNIAGTDKTSYTVTGLKSQTQYTFAVRGESKGKFTPYKTTSVKTAQGIVIKGFTSVVTDSTIQLKWTAVSGASRYNIYLKDASGAYKLYKYTAANSLKLTGMKAGTAYSFAIRGVVNGKDTEYSYLNTSTLKADVKVKFEALNQLGGGGNSGKVVATYGCGGTSTTMLLNAKGKNLNKDTVLAKQYANGWNACGVSMSLSYGAKNCGSVMGNLVTLANSYGFKAKVNTAPTTDDIKRVLAGNNLVLVGLRTASGAYHFQIIYGYYVYNGVTYFRMQDPYGNYCVNWTADYLKNRIYAVNMNDYLCSQVRGIMWLE